jgi:tetratricopeptide (TPR) repeat protein
MAEHSTFSERDRLLKSMLSKPSYDHEHAASLLLNMISAQSSEFLFSSLALVDQFIEDEKVPEEMSQRLLRIKVLYLIDKKAYDPALNLLKNLNDSEYRLACNTIEFYKLLLLEAQVFIAQEKYDQAYEFLIEIKGYLITEDCKSLIGHEELLEMWNYKMAIAAHFAQKDISYQCFNQVLNKPGHVLQLDQSNKMFFFTFANECFRQKKYNEATSVYSELFKLENTHRNASMVPDQLFFQVTAMVIISRLLDHQSLETVKEELAIIEKLRHSSQCFMSENIKHLMKMVRQLVDKSKSLNFVRDDGCISMKLYCPKFSGTSLVESSSSQDLLCADDAKTYTVDSRY